MKGAPLNSWIKFEKSLANDPRIAKLGSDLRNAIRNGSVTEEKLNLFAALGAMTVFWGLADSHIGADNTLRCGADEINQLIGIAGFAQILPSDWLQIIDPNSVHLPHFLQHNGIEAKQRALNAKRQARHRERHNDTVTPKSRKSNAKRNASVTLNALPDQDQDIYIKQDNPLPLHDSLPTEQWAEWLSWRKSKRMPCDTLTLSKQLKLLAPLSTVAQIATIDKSIQANWQGLFPDKANGGYSAPQASPAPIRNSAEWAELLAAARAEDFRNPATHESAQEFAEELRRYRNRLAPKVDTSAVTAKLRALL